MVEHTVKAFDSEIDALRGLIAEMGGLAEVAIAGDVGEGWERLDRWTLFSEELGLIMDARHSLASRPGVDIDDLRQERGDQSYLHVIQDLQLNPSTCHSEF